MKNATLPQKSLVAAVVAGILASLCCVGPLVLVLLGIGGAWVSTLTALDPIRPYAIVITLLFLGVAFWKLYITPRRCASDEVCANPKLLHVQRWIFWIVAVVLILLLSFPWYASLFY